MSTPSTQAIEAALAPLAQWYQWIGEMMAAHAAAKAVHGQVLEALLERGWCHSYHFTDGFIVELGELAQAGRWNEFEESMAQFTRLRLDNIRTTACEKYPDRATILADAFDAHQAGKYTLSVPAFLSQLDGIGCDVMRLGRYFFSEKRRTNALSAITGNLKFPDGDRPYPLSQIDRRMLAALERTWQLTSDTDERDESESPSCPLNRNGVLHGVDTNYATEFNSLRCVLLLGYVLEVRQVLHEDLPAHLQELGRSRNTTRPST